MPAPRPYGSGSRGGPVNQQPQNVAPPPPLPNEEFVPLDLGGVATTITTPAQFAWKGGNEPKTTTAPKVKDPWLSEKPESQLLYERQRNEFATPSFGETYGQNLAQSQHAQTGAQNVANQYAQQFNQQIGQDPGLGAYYDRAKERTSADINQQLAARGAYGSSVGIGMVGDALGGLEAQRAKEEADYMLQQQRLGGELAGQAGQSMLGWTQGLGGLALGADAAKRGRIGLGYTAAGSADQARLNRRGQAFNEIFGLTGMAANQIGGAQLCDVEAEFVQFEAEMNAKYGAATEEYNQAMQAKKREMEALGMAFKIGGAIIGGVAGGPAGAVAGYAGGAALAEATEEKDK